MDENIKKAWQGKVARLEARLAETEAERGALMAALAECTEKRERYALQVCLLLDAMREAGVHIAEKWCWCQPTVETYDPGAKSVCG